MNIYAGGVEFRGTTTATSIVESWRTQGWIEPPPFASSICSLCIRCDASRDCVIETTRRGVGTKCIGRVVRFWKLVDDMRNLRNLVLLRKEFR